MDFHKKRKEEKKVKEDLVEVIDELGRNRWVPREEAQSSEDEEELEKERMKYEPKPGKSTFHMNLISYYLFVHTLTNTNHV